MVSNVNYNALYCRLCLDSTIKYPNFVDVSADRQIFNKITKLFNLSLDDPELSSLICFNCRYQIDNTMDFMDTVSKNQEILKTTRGVFIKEEPEDSVNPVETQDEPYLFVNGIKVEVIENDALNITPQKKKIKEERPKEEYICDICKKSFKMKYLLANHMREHMENIWYDCPDCEERLRTKKELNKHKLLMHKNSQVATVKYYDKFVDISNYLFCELCEGKPKFETFELMCDHYKAIHGVRGYVKCCNRKFQTKRSVVIHCDLHSSPLDYMCTICQKVLPNKSSLKDHMDRHKPEEEKLFQCEHCQKKFYRASFLNYHVKNTHSKDKREKVECEICHKLYASKFLLDRHVERVHAEKKELPYICETCGKRNFTEKDLQSHIKFKHSQIVVKCDLCGKYVKCLRRHLKMHAEAQLDIYCDICGRSVPSSSALIQHMKMHQEKDYKCEVCGEAFRRKGALQDHMSQHNGIPGYFCNYCDRTFNNSGNKYKHIKQNHFEEHQKALEAKRIMKEQYAIANKAKNST